MVLNKNIKIKDNDDSLLLNIPNEKDQTCVTDKTKFEKNLNYFHVMDHDEPHFLRRNQIIKAHPEIKKLFVKEPMTAVWVLWIHLFQLYSCFVISHYDFSFPVLLVLSYFIGAVPNHALYALIHDITHFLCFKSVNANKYLGIIANLPQVIPSAVTFGRYHRDHHSNMGDPLHDPDLPTDWEIKFFNTWYKRLLYVCLMPLFYAIRPFFKGAKELSFLEYVNILTCFIYGYCINFFFGYKALIYLITSTLFGLSINPIGGHLIAEHYEFNKGQDSQSYYGWMNYINFNVGIHVEHHDFPNIPWSKLPQVRKIAPEFYDTLPEMKSYSMALYKYVFDDTIGPWSRIAINLKKVWNEESGDYKNDEDIKPKEN